MKKFVLRFIFLLCLFTCLNCYETQAASISDFETITKQEINANDILKEEKILKYDARTNTTTEVDMNEIIQILDSKNLSSANSTTPYIPTKKMMEHSKILTPNNLKSYYYMLINDTTTYPYTTISKITNSGGSGSGTIIGKNVAITVAHVIMDGDGNFYSNCTIMPGYSNGLMSNLSTGWVTAYYSSNWAAGDHSTDSDWCILVLNSDIGLSTGWCGLQYYGDSTYLNNESACAYGYPGEQSFNGEYQYVTQRYNFFCK